jgi:hypothetical protein
MFGSASVLSIPEGEIMKQLQQHQPTIQHMQAFQTDAGLVTIIALDDHGKLWRGCLDADNKIEWQAVKGIPYASHNLTKG